MQNFFLLVCIMLIFLSGCTNPIPDNNKAQSESSSHIMQSGNTQSGNTQTGNNNIGKKTTVSIFSGGFIQTSPMLTITGTIEQYQKDLGFESFFTEEFFANRMGGEFRGYTYYNAGFFSQGHYLAIDAS